MQGHDVSFNQAEIKLRARYSINNTASVSYVAVIEIGLK